MKRDYGIKKLQNKLCIFTLVAVLLVSHFLPVRVLAEGIPEEEASEVLREEEITEVETTTGENEAGEEDQLTEVIVEKTKKVSETVEKTDDELKEAVVLEELKTAEDAKDKASDTKAEEKKPGGKIDVINTDEKAKKEYITFDGETFTVAVSGLNVVFDGNEHPVRTDYTFKSEDGKEYAVHLNVEYEKDDASVSAPLHAGDYTATVTGWTVKEDGKEVSDLKVSANNATVKINKRALSVVVAAEKKIEKPNGNRTPHVAGFTISIPDVAVADEYKLKESDIEFVGDKDHVECVEVNYTDRLVSRAQLYSANFVNHNEDYNATYQFDGDGEMIIVVDPTQHSPFFRVQLSNKTTTYNGTEQVFHPEVSGHSDVFTMSASPSNTTDYIFKQQYCTFYITIDPSRLSVAKKGCRNVQEPVYADSGSRFRKGSFQ